MISSLSASVGADSWFEKYIWPIILRFKMLFYHLRQKSLRQFRQIFGKAFA